MIDWGTYVYNKRFISKWCVIYIWNMILFAVMAIYIMDYITMQQASFIAGVIGIGGLYYALKRKEERNRKEYNQSIAI
jgi:hypothetical protein